MEFTLSRNTLRHTIVPSVILAMMLVLPPSLMAATLTVPDARGTYTLSGTETRSNCSFPGDNGIFAISGMLTIISQTGANFSGSGTFIQIEGDNTHLIEIMVTGDIDVSGQFSGTFTGIGSGCGSDSGGSGSGTFSGSLVGNVITVAITPQSDCTELVSLSGSRVSPGTGPASASVPDARGTYTLSGTGTDSNCPNPDWNGTFAISGMLTIVSQTGATFSGSMAGKSDTSVLTGINLWEVMVTGGIDASGQFSGTLTFIGSGCGSESGSGTFSGSLAGNAITVAFTAQSDCTVMGSLSGSRVSPGTGPTSAMVTDFGDTGAPGQLRTLVTAAAPGDTIVIQAGTITLGAGGALTITRDLILLGAGPTLTSIDSAGTGPVVEVTGGSVVISGVTIGRGSAGAGASSGAGLQTRDTGAASGCAPSATPRSGSGISFNSLAPIFLMDACVIGNSNTSLIEGGGGITIASGSGPVRIVGVTISGNSAATVGGGIFNGGVPLTVINATLSGNSAGVGGGGIANSSAGSVTLANVTLSGNTAASGGGILNGGGTVQLKNTLVANSPSGGNCAGPITSLGHNLDSGTTCSLTGPGDLSNANPLLGPLQDNGGPTQTHALLPGSQAIDTGDPAGCTDTLGMPLTTDQRGIARPQGAACDIGAYELETPRLTGLATRGLVQTGGNVLIGGVIIGGSTPKTVVVRALGPSLGLPPFNVPGTLANPTLTLFSGATPIASNDDWQVLDPLCASTGHLCGPPAQIAAAGAPSDPLEAALLITLPPGPYTAIVSGVGGSTGVGLVEVYEVGGP